MRASIVIAQLLLAACTAAVADDKSGNANVFQQYVEKFGAPGPEHKLLEPLVGTWHATVKTWMDPNQPPQVSDGTLVRKSVMDGRFVQEDFDGKMLDRAFRGCGLIGFDRAKNKFVTTWIDSVTTAIQTASGTYDSYAKTWTFKQEDTCPITGKHVKMRDVLRIVGPDQQQMEMFRQLGDDKEARMMEITLTRKR
jgi:hypothetical protein